MAERRVLVADGKVGMTGGVGIAEEWTGDAQNEEHWRDTHVRLHGPVVRHLQGCFAEHWLEATGEVLSGEDYLPHLDATDANHYGFIRPYHHPGVDLRGALRKRFPGEGNVEAQRQSSSCSSGTDEE